jgi:hypothetical protein
VICNGQLFPNINILQSVQKTDTVEAYVINYHSIDTISLIPERLYIGGEKKAVFTSIQENKLLVNSYFSTYYKNISIAQLDIIKEQSLLIDTLSSGLKILQDSYELGPKYLRESQKLGNQGYDLALKYSKKNKRKNKGMVISFTVGVVGGIILVDKIRK